ncbi:hypothetical protein [Nostoc sp. CENA543]|uniref:hypothetical protein n=1 Tax=Nostoc sp. CENA543 TaxID=1869241 RepID=UPI0012FFFA3C|nr:hypothetical protein [Nostoc sp. CENA543]
MNVLFWLLIIAIVYGCYNNALPYIAFIRLRIGDSFLAGLPYVGGFFRFFSLSTLVGIVFWAILQIMQLLPLWVKADRKLIRTVIRQSENHPQMKIGKEDSKSLAALKKIWNEFPLRSIKWARTCSYIAYSIDYVACIHAFPPVDGGLDRFFYVIATRQFDLLNLGNIISLIITIYLVEALFVVLLQVQEFIYFQRLAKSEV